MHVHILGVGGTFMSALALLARKQGFKVTGSDANCYPPVSDLLTAEGVTWTEGYTETRDALAADLVVVGNAVTRGMPVMEAVLDAGKTYISGPQWLAEHILPRFRVLAVAGTHGKTTTSSMLALILEEAGLKPGFLIGGIATNFKTNVRMGEGEWFVIEADEYDSAFFDKRPKFMHYHPECAILNNLEFDHADIYPDLAAIQQQVHYFLRTIPAKGEVLYPRDDKALAKVFKQGVFSGSQSLASSGKADWRAELIDPTGAHFHVLHKGVKVAEVEWGLMGQFNVDNGLAALAASAYAGVAPEVAAKALGKFLPAKRRLETRMNAHGITLYDDFAHHPTAIEKTITALKAQKQHERVLVVVEFASHSMRMGVHGKRVAEALKTADSVYVFAEQTLPVEVSADLLAEAWQICDARDALVSLVSAEVKPGDAVVVMSNRSLEAVHQGLMKALNQRFCE